MSQIATTKGGGQSQQDQQGVEQALDEEFTTAQLNVLYSEPPSGQLDRPLINVAKRTQFQDDPLFRVDATVGTQVWLRFQVFAPSFVVDITVIGILKICDGLSALQDCDGNVLVTGSGSGVAVSVPCVILSGGGHAPYDPSGAADGEGDNPNSGFSLNAPDACAFDHWHGTVFILEGGSIADPDASGCGHGTKIATASGVIADLGDPDAGSPLAEVYIIVQHAAYQEWKSDRTKALLGTSVANVIGVDVQAWDDDLDDIAALTPTDGNVITGNGTDWTSAAPAAGRLKRDPVDKSASYTAAMGESVAVDMASASGDVTITLPNITAGNLGEEVLIFQRTVHASHQLLVDGDGADKINASSSPVGFGIGVGNEFQFGVLSSYTTSDWVIN